MHPPTRLVLFALLHLMAAPAARATETPNPNEKRVREYVSAFNARSIDTMMGMVTDDIQWLSVVGDTITVETQGKAKLRESMAGYFESNPTAKSELEWVRTTDSRVAALEKASWQGKSGPKSQSSLSVYEIREGLIAKVYYFPAEK